MVWSNWRGAVVLMFVWVGLAWSQAPTPTTSPGAGERIMTLHENGKSIRCRVLLTWSLADGAKAFQLQTIDTGETITIVEDGPGITLQEPLLGGRVRSLPMRIFHWGTSLTPPDGVPTPPDVVILASGQKIEPAPAKQVGPNNSEPIFSRPIGKDRIIRWEQKDEPAKDSLVGKSKVPVVVNPNFAPAVAHDDKIVATLPKEPNRVEIPDNQRLLPNLVPVPSNKSQGSYVQVGATVLPNRPAPADAQPQIATLIPTVPPAVPTEIVKASNSVVATAVQTTAVPATAIVATPFEPKRPEQVQTINNFKPATPPQTLPSSATPTTDAQLSIATPPSSDTGKTEPKVLPSTNTASTIPTDAGKSKGVTLASGTVNDAPGAEVPPPPPALAQNAPPPSPLASYAPVTPAALPAPDSLPPTNTVQAPVFRSGLAPLTNPTTPAPNVPAITKEPAPTTAETASTTKPADTSNSTAKTARPTMIEKLQNWMHPKKDTPPTKPADAVAKQNGGSNTPSNTNVATAPPPANTAPFSTAANPNIPADGPSTPSPTPNQPVPTANQNIVGATPAQAQDKTPETPQPSAAAAPKKDWRLMWGQPRDNKTQVPGQATVAQASMKPDPNSVPHLPPASNSEKADILLNPEKFDPSGARLVPKGIHMDSYRGDPATLMTKAPSANVPPANVPPANPPLPNVPPTNVTQTAAQAETPAPTLTDHAYPPTPPPPLSMPGTSGPLPPGAQSVVAAGANVAGTPVYVPAPNGAVPPVTRAPMPPAGMMPEPPPGAPYGNAFTPPPPPPSSQEQNPMNVNAFTNMASPNPNMVPPYMPPNQMMPQNPAMQAGTPNFTPTNYQPNPMAQGYPVTPGYPPNPSTMMQQGMPNPYYYAPQGAAPPQPGYSPQGYPMAQVNFPQNYQGPQPPNPFGNQGQQQMPPQYQPQQYQPAPMSQPSTNSATERHMVPGANADASQFMQVLRESPYPAQREWASNTLSTFDWRSHPEIVQLLLQVAQQDPTPTVRASCIFSLGRMNAASEPVIAILNTLRADGDPRVRQEVEQALYRMGATKQQ
jgi:hypothetical protein